MRDLEQAKAEVFRRSDARIKKRKAIRRGVVACCVPLVLCIGFWSVTILPAMMPAKSADSAESAVMDNTNGIAYGAAPDSIFDNWFHRFTGGTGLDDKEVTAENSSWQKALIQVHGEDYPLCAADAEIIYNILKDLNYHPHRVCKCLPQLTLQIDGASYGIHLNEGYARCSEGQADLTPDQIQQIREVLSRNEIEFY